MLLSFKRKSRSDISGRECEKIACSYLKSKGYKIIKRNYLCELGEIDIIADDGKRLVFVEVKSRNSTTFGLGRDAVDKEKLRKMRNASAFYMKRVYKSTRPLRYDLIEIYDGKIFAHLEAII